MSEAHAETVLVGRGEAGRDIAVLRRQGRSPGIFWLGGFRSEMTGSKATALDELGARTGHAVTRFDYSGHGASGGRFADGTVSRWLEEALAVFERTEGPQVVVGSSMGGWLALLLARALGAAGQGARLKALVLIAPAVDMTEELMRAGFTEAQRAELDSRGAVAMPSAYGEPYEITRAFLDDGAQHLMFGGPIEPGCPVTILQGGRDAEVPREHALRLVAHIVTDPVSFTLVPDGDHRLSREDDLGLLTATVQRALAD